MLSNLLLFIMPVTLFAPVGALQFSGPASLSSWCGQGINNGNVCCDLACGACGGTGCSSRPGGSSQCCSSSITKSCESFDDVACVLPGEPKAETPQIVEDGAEAVEVAEAQEEDNYTMNNKNLSVAVYLQVGYVNSWDDLFMCTSNVVSAATTEKYKKVDVFASVMPLPSVPNISSAVLAAATTFQYEESQNFAAPLDHLSRMIQMNLEGLTNVGRVVVTKTENNGADVGAFIRMLSQEIDYIASEGQYDVILKMHTESDSVWRERAIESLCGTPEQVLSVFKHFRDDTALDMVAPLGTAFGPTSELSEIFPHFVKKYKWQTQSDIATAFNHSTYQKMNSIHQMMFPVSNADVGQNISYDDIVSGGTMFWIRYSALHVQELLLILPELEAGYTEGYVAGGSVEHVMGSFLATQISLRKRKIADISPAPRVVAMYFPQFHEIPENDRFWGKGFTEWTLLKPLEIEGLRKPLSLEKGGLGYYDLMSKDTRKAQADMARQHGVNGFIYYHYWFSGSNAPHDHLVMHQVEEQMLLDGEPNLPFAFSWANEPWTLKWTGVGHPQKGDNVLLSQEYGDEKEWREHFDYLMKFFSHPNYIRIQGEPVFIIYRIGHFKEKLQPMLELWRDLAMQAGLPGIRFVNTIGPFRNEDENTAEVETSSKITSAFHYWPHLHRSGFDTKQLGADTASRDDLSSLLETYPIQFWGAFTGFDRRPRDPDSRATLVSIDDFDRGLECSFSAMSGSKKRDIDKNLYFVTAWNEWNEQGILEPDAINGFGYLQTISTRLSEFPISIVSPREEKEKDAIEREQLKMAKCLA